MSYAINKIFSDGNVNAILDRIIYELEKELSDGKTISSIFGLSGRAAALLQGEHVPQCENIVFVTNDAALYSFVQNVLPRRIKNDGVVRYHERTLYYFMGLYLEIWFLGEGTFLDLTMINNVSVQPVAKIPAQTL